jgi:O-antigen/teichoic acid export membrane protein
MGSNFAIIFISNLSARILGFIAFAMVSKNLEANDFLSLILSNVIILSCTDISIAGLNQSIIREFSKLESKSKRWSANLGSAIILAMIISLACAVCIYVFLYVGIKLPTYTAGIFAIYSIFNTLNTCFASIFTGSRQFHFYSAVTVLPILLQVIFIVSVLFSIGISLVVLALISLIAASITSIIFIIMLSGAFKWGVNYRILKRHWTFGRYYYLWSIISTLENRADYFILYKFMPASIPVLEIANRFLQIIQYFISSTVTVLLPGSSGQRKLPFKYLNQLLGSQKKLLLACHIANLFLVLVVTAFIHFYYDGRYDEAIYLYGLFSIAMIFVIKTIPYNVKFFRAGDSKGIATGGLVASAIRIISLISLLNFMGIIAAGISMISSQISLWIYFRYKAKK